MKTLSIKKSCMKALMVFLTSVAVTSVFAVSLPQQAYITHPDYNGLSAYNVNLDSGELTPADQPSVNTGKGPTGVTTLPDGVAVYVANSGSNTISMFGREATTGVLTPFNPSTIATGSVPTAMTIINNRYAYMMNNGSNTVSMYLVEGLKDESGNPYYSRWIPTGPLTKAIAIDGSYLPDVPTGPGPVSMVTDISKGYAYVLNNGVKGGGIDGIYMYIVELVTADESGYYSGDGTGNLTLMKIIPTGKNPVAMEIASDLQTTYPYQVLSNYAYVLNQGDNTISMYSVDHEIDGDTGAATPTGGLTPLEPSTVSTGSNPSAMVLFWWQRMLYVINKDDNTVSSYDIDGATGQLYLAQTISTGKAPTAMTLDIQNMYVYVTNSGDNTISAYEIDINSGLLSLEHTLKTSYPPEDIAITPLGTSY